VVMHNMILLQEGMHFSRGHREVVGDGHKDAGLGGDVGRRLDDSIVRTLPPLNQDLAVAGKHVAVSKAVADHVKFIGTQVRLAPAEALTID